MEQNMKKSDFSFDLPKELIAQEPCSPRDAARLLCLGRESGAIEHRVFHDLPQLLRPGDLLVVNNSKVLPARLIGHKEGTGAVCELLLLRETARDEWECLARPGKRLHMGNRVVFGDGSLCAEILATREDGNKIVRFSYDTQTLYEKLDAFGKMPLPPYIQKQLDDQSQYQTVYAKELGSAAAPTAGLHFTPALMQTLERCGIGFAEVTLHVGLGTFRPVKEENILEHKMHSEWYCIDEATAGKIAAAKKRGEKGHRRGHDELPHAGGRRHKIRRDLPVQRRDGHLHLSRIQIQGHRRPDHQFPSAGIDADHAGERVLRL